jgi:hypothetical protein
MKIIKKNDVSFSINKPRLPMHPYLKTADIEKIAGIING